MVSSKVRHRKKVLYTAVQMIDGDCGHESQESIAKIKKGCQERGFATLISHADTFGINQFNVGV